MEKSTFMLFLLLLWCPVVFAAPHINNAIPEPPEYPGTRLQERFVRAMPTGQMLAPATYPTLTVNILFLRVEFQEDPSPSSSKTTGSGLWLDPLYSQGTGTPQDTTDLNDPSNFWVNRARTKFVEYWKEVSYGMLPISIDVSQKVYQLSHTMANYGDESNVALESLIYDSITTALRDANPPTFSNYDAVLIVHAGVGQETDQHSLTDPLATPNDIWSLYYNGYGRICEVSTCLTTSLRNGYPIGEAIIMPQTDTRNLVTVDPLGIYVHEFGHWLGLLDLYCTSPDTCQMEGAGDWSLMAHGLYNGDPKGSSPAHPDVWSLALLGWVTPQTVSDYQSVTLNPMESVPTVINLATAMASTNVIMATASTNTTHQYFLIENRQKIGYDSGLPGHGLLVWLVDKDVIDANFSSNSINNNLAQPGLKLIEADNDWSLLGTGSGSHYGSAGDPFPGSSDNLQLTPVTAPASLPYTPYGNVNIRNINEASAIVSFTIGFGPLPPTNLAADLDTKTISWDKSDGATDYYVYKNGSQARLGSTGGASSFADSDFLTANYYSVTAVDVDGNESQAADISIQPTGSGTGKGGGKIGCFIATAAYGSYLDPHVKILRDFRDQYLITNYVGRALVSYYYHYSPPLADFISRHEQLRSATRWMLTLIIFMVQYPVSVILLGMIGVVLIRRKTA